MRGRRWTFVSAVLVAVLIAGCDGGDGGSDGGSSSSSSSLTSAATARRPLDGFGEVAFRVSPGGEKAGEWCALLADTAAARSKGLMDQDDLRGYDAMVFRYDAPSTGAYYMFHTRIPLSIAWFDRDGAFVSSSDMDPCPSDDPAACPRYGASGPYLHALEAGKGDLGRLGIGPGSTLTFAGGGCDR